MNSVAGPGADTRALASARERLMRLTSLIVTLFWLPVVAATVASNWSRRGDLHGLYVGVLLGLLSLGAITWRPSRRYVVGQALAFLAVAFVLLVISVRINGPAPGNVAAVCLTVAWATLFFGVRGLVASTIVLAVSFVLTAWHSLDGVPFLPDLGVSDVGYWLRAGVVLIGSSTIIGFMVRAAVGAYERTLEREREAQATAAREETARLVAEAETDVLQRRQLVGALASGLAHDLNNIIQITAAHAEILRESASSGTDRESVDQILAAADRAKIMVRQLLTLGRESARHAPSSGFDGALAVQRLEVMLRSVMPPHVRAQFVTPAGCVLAGDEGHFAQVLINLVLNACDAMPATGSLTVTLGAENDAECRLEVRDTGTGIPQELREKIFTPFFTTKPPSEGSGFGLAAVARAVHDIGGRITFDSAVGEGTTFTVIWPRQGLDRDAAP